MAKVYNRQLKRDMEYPYEVTPPDKQIAYVFDTNKCIACQTCTVACKTTWTSGKGQEHIFWNNVETKPYGSYPESWDMNLLQMVPEQRWKGDTFAGRTIFDNLPANGAVTGHHPKEADYAHPNLGEDEIYGMVQEGAFFGGVHPMWMFYLARICNHCTTPACAAACPRKAIYKRQEDGIVLIDQTRCRGYQECVKACPYKKIFFNTQTQVSEKCIGCFPLIEKGEQPRCVQTCIGKIRMQGWLSQEKDARKDNPIDQLVHFKKLALPLYPQFGTGPNVYYIPPIHVDKKFLRQLFGPGVDHAVATYQSIRERGDSEAIAAMLLFGNSPIIIERYEYTATETIGFDRGNKEVVRVPLTEPFIVRPHHDKKHDVYRLNTA